MTRDAPDRRDVKTYRGEDVSQGYTVLKTPSRKAVFSGGLLAAVLVAMVVAAGHGFSQTGPGPEQGSPVSNASPAPGASSGQSTASKPDPQNKNAEAAKPATRALVIGLDTLEGVTGKTVRSAAANEDMGRIVDILVDMRGETRAAVIDFGGFLGVGSRKVAVDWKTLDFAGSIKSGSVKVSLTRDQVRQSPEYKTGEPVVILQGSSPSPAMPDAGVAGPAH